MAGRGGLTALLCCIAVCSAALLVEGRTTAFNVDGGMSQADRNAVEILERVRHTRPYVRATRPLFCIARRGITAASAPLFEGGRCVVHCCQA